MIYFDNAATTFPKPQAVANALWDAVAHYGGNPSRSGHQIAMRTSEKVFAVRNRAAQFFGADVENVVFTMNCTHALNMAIKGIMADGGHIILSCLEHNSVFRPVYALSKTGRVEYDIAAVYEDPEATLASFQRRVRPNTRVIVCTHVSNVTGQILPVAEIGTFCRQHNILFILDAAQSAGVLPVDIEKQNIDLLCTAGHKGLYGPTGTGLLVLGKRVGLLHTIMEGGSGSTSIEPEAPDFYPDRLESGTINSSGIIALGAGIQFVQKRTLGQIYRHEMQIYQQVYEGLRRIPKVTIYSGEPVFGRQAPVLSFNLEGHHSMDVCSFLNQEGFALRSGLHCSPLAHHFLHTEEIGAVRFSPGIYNTTAQAEAFIRSVYRFSKI